MLRLSYSQIKLYKSSPLDYFYKYVQRLPEKDNETKWLHFGLGVHEVLEDYYSNKNKDWRTNAESKFKSYNLKGRMNEDDFKKNIVNGISIDWNITDLEEEMYVDVYPTVSFIGYIDVLDKTNHTILDWKTGTYTKEKEDDYKAQLLCYAWMYYLKYSIVPSKCALFFTKQVKLVEFSFDLKQIYQFDNYVKRIAKEILHKKAIHIHAEEWGNELGFFSGYHYLDGLPSTVFKIHIKGNQCYLSGSLSPVLTNMLKSKFAVDHQSKHHMQKHILLLHKGKKPWNYNDIGTRYLYNKRFNSFPIGLLNNVRKIINDYAEYKKTKIYIKIIDTRDKSIMNKKLNIMPDKLLSDKTLRPYQIRAVYSFIDNGGFGMLNVATGGGKSLITAEIIRRLDTPTLWIINQKELLNQTKKVFEEELGIDIGVIGAGNFEPKNITVATVQTLNNKIKLKDKQTLDFMNNIAFVIVDESHNLGCDTYEKVFDYLPNAKQRLGTTGTAFREDKQDMRMFALVGKPICDITADYLIDKGYLQKPTIKFIKMDSSNVTPINYYLLSTEERKQAKAKEYSREYEESVVLHTERNNIVKYYATHHENDKVLIIVKSIEHGKILNELIPESVFIHGSLKKNIRHDYFTHLKESESCIVIATIKIASEGLDVPDLTTLINASANKSDNRSIQSLGRILRKANKKTGATYIDFIDKSKHGNKHSWKRLKTFKSVGYKINIIKNTNIYK